ncbi:hypothetical protein V1290_005957 [Bradyrhizobium sp. AZCC 1578]
MDALARKPAVEISEDELSKLSVGVGELEQMPELPDGDRSPFRDMTFIL